MSYSRLEPGLPRHPKTLRLMRALGLRRYEAVGLLSMFWCWVQETRPSGALDGIEPADIDASLDWTGAPLGETLIACGWIDRLDDGRLEVHGWLERAEGYQHALRERDRRAAARAARMAHADGTHGAPMPHRGEERRGEEKKGEDRGSRARDQQDEQVQAVEPTALPEPDPHGHAEPEDVDRRHATSGRHRLPCTPQAVLDAWERVCVPAGHPRAVATGERASAELLRTVTAALERGPSRGAWWWEGTYLPALVADAQVGAPTRRRAGPANIGLACREAVIQEVLARAEVRARASPEPGSEEYVRQAVAAAEAMARGEM